MSESHIRTKPRRTTSLALVLAAVCAATLPAAAQQQPGNRPSGWPCGARLDLSYFRVAEGSGGHLLLLSPEEIGGSASLLTALGGHPQTIFRTAGTMQPGLHEIAYPSTPRSKACCFRSACSVSRRLKSSGRLDKYPSETT